MPQTIETTVYTFAELKALGNPKATERALARDLSRGIYKWLRETLEAAQSDDAIADLADANDYTFTAAGRRFG